ncbi:MAG: hypothetical protein ICV69_11530 [Thermoleophilaceae bacterium]|nr:hypothetical protein [Thermoleophilaceae bacterium]
MEEQPPGANDDLVRLRNKAREQEAEITRLRAEAAEASGERGWPTSR